MATYAAEYTRPHDGFGGNPWSKERVASEVEKMREFLVEPRRRCIPSTWAKG